jgi:hypothetical protein
MDKISSDFLFRLFLFVGTGGGLLRCYIPFEPLRAKERTDGRWGETEIGRQTETEGSKQKAVGRKKRDQSPDRRKKDRRQKAEK